MKYTVVIVENLWVNAKNGKNAYEFDQKNYVLFCSTGYFQQFAP